MTAALSTPRPSTTLAWLLVLLLTVAPPAMSAARAHRPNVVLMMADDMGWGDAGFMGHPHLQTPHLDAMAKAGLRFHRFYAAAPVCSPTRGSCLTGRHPYRYGIFNANSGHLPAGEVNLAELLRKAGYTTGHFGKWHLGTLTKTERDSNRGGPQGVKHFAPPWERGFDVSFSTEAKTPTWDPMIRPRKTARGTGSHARGKWWDPVRNKSDAKGYGTFYWSAKRESSRAQQRGRKVLENLKGDDSRIIMDRVVPFVQSAVGANKPFLAVIWFHAPHLPVVSGPEFTERYASFSKYKQHYFGCITAMDTQVGRLRRTLRELGAEHNTMLWFCSDNGPEGNARAPGSARSLRGRKRSLYEGGVRVPGIVVYPELVKAGSATDEPATTTDYLPTILDVLDIPYPGQQPLDGVSLKPLLSGESWSRPRPIAFESCGRVALLGRRFKLLAKVGGATGRRGRVKPPIGAEKPLRTVELYDIQADPSESKNLAAENPKEVARMSELLVKWRRSCAKSRSELRDQ